MLPLSWQGGHGNPQGATITGGFFTFRCESRKLSLMSSPVAAFALEFDVLIKRAARTGQVPLDTLTDTYIALHPELPDGTQSLDLARLCSALAALPEGLCEASRLLLVPDINGFSHTPARGGTFVCGRMADGTWLGDLSAGYADLVRWLSCLCEIRRGQRQATRLLAAQPDPETDNALGHLAFAWGCDEVTLQNAIGSCGPALLSLLQAGANLPIIVVHAASNPSIRARQHARDAGRAVQAVAEMGLIDRPLHLWLGEGRISDCLSPYSRELKDALWRWAQTHPQHVGPDIPSQPSDDALYAICDDFMAHDPRLVGEKEDAERTVGIYQHAVADLRVEMIDLGRTDPTLCDPRLPAFRLHAPAPVLIRVDAPDSQLLAAALEAFIHTLGHRLASITIVLPTQAPAAMAGEIILPRFAVNWAGGQKLPLLNDALSPQDFIGLADRPVQAGDTLLVPALGLHTPGALELMADDPSIACVQLGSTDMVATLHDAIWTGKVSERLECAWLAVPLVAAHTGRPTLMCLRSLSAVAVARLRRIVAPSMAPGPQAMPPAPHTPQPTAPSANESRRRAAWAMRIKA